MVMIIEAGKRIKTISGKLKTNVTKNTKKAVIAVRRYAATGNERR